jgi:hypothetical protein
LLVCVDCQKKLDEVEIFALAMREAITNLPEAPPRKTWFAWPSLAWAGGFAAIVLAAGIYLNLGRSHALAPLASLELTAMRGDMLSAPPARETRITLADAPAEPTLRAEVVDAIGAAVWRGTIKGTIRGEKHTIDLAKRLAPGNYFVRLYDDTGKLLHEYGFRVRTVL